MLQLGIRIIFDDSAAGGDILSLKQWWDFWDLAMVISLTELSLGLL